MSVGLLEAQSANVSVSFRPFGLVEQPTVERLQSRAANAVRDIFGLLEDISVQAVSCPTAEDFRAFRDEVYPSYLQLSFASANVLAAKLDPSDLPSLIEESFDHLHAQFESDAPLYFGEDAYNEILFSLSTLKSAYRWLPHVFSNKPEESKREEDNDLSNKFGGAVTWAQFHLSGLTIAIRKKQTIIPEVLRELLDGLRHSVMAYAYIRTALDLRNFPNPQYAEGLEISWDAEDESLANAD